MAPTEKQISVLLRAGYQLEELEPLLVVQVSQLIDLVRTNGWRRLTLQQVEPLYARRAAALFRARTWLVTPTVVDERLDRLFRRSGAMYADDEYRLMLKAEKIEDIGFALLRYRLLCGWGEKWRMFLEAIEIEEEMSHAFMHTALRTDYVPESMRRQLERYGVSYWSTAPSGVGHVLEILLRMEKARAA